MSTTPPPRPTDRPRPTADAASSSHGGAGARAVYHTARSEALRRHLRAALTAVALAVVLLTALSTYAADGIAQARRAALDQARSGAASSAPADD